MVKEISRWENIGKGNIFISRGQGLLGKAVSFWANGWSHCGIIDENRNNLVTIEAYKKIISQPLEVYKELWDSGDLRVFDLEADTRTSLSITRDKLNKAYDWIGDILLFFILPLEQLIWRYNLHWKLPKLLRTEREKCSETVLLYLQDTAINNLHLGSLELVWREKDIELCIPSDILNLCLEIASMDKK